jgi:hypothetical protein
MVEICCYNVRSLFNNNNKRVVLMECGALIIITTHCNGFVYNCLHAVLKRKICWNNPHEIYTINPLTPELNPSVQRCLTRFFTGDFAS